MICVYSLLGLLVLYVIIELAVYNKEFLLKINALLLFIFIALILIMVRLYMYKNELIEVQTKTNQLLQQQLKEKAK